MRRGLMTVPVFEGWTWPWPAWTLHFAYLVSGLLIAVHYIPQISRAWQFPAATLTAQSLASWCVWTACRVVALVYGVFVIHDLIFIVVVGLDILGRLTMVLLIVRAWSMSAARSCPLDLVPARSAVVSWFRNVR